MALRFSSLLHCTLALLLTAPLAAQTMVGYGLEVGRAASAAGGLKKTGEAAKAGLEKASSSLSAPVSSRSSGSVVPAVAPDAATVDDQPRPSLVRVVRAAWGDDPSGAPLERADAAPDPVAAASRTDGAKAALADPATEAASRLRVGMSVAEAFELLGEPSFSFLGVSGAGYDAKYVFQVRDNRVVAEALEGVVTRILIP